MEKVTGKKILIISYVWPPFVAVGVYRILKFCKYLRDFGIEPVILTPKSPATMSQDDGLFKEVPENIKVYHSFALEPFKWRGTPVKKDQRQTPPTASALASGLEPAPGKSFIGGLKKLIRANLTVPDNAYFWSWTGIAAGMKAIRENAIDAVLSSSPPHSVHILGSRLARASRLPHIVDFRDLWTQNTKSGERRLSDRLQRRNRKYELKVLKNSAAICVNTLTFKQQLLEDNDFLRPEDIEVITNGVDPDDFRELTRKNCPNDKFTMVYTGSLYRQRGPAFFFEALRDWVRQRPEVRPRMQVVFIGNWAEEYSGVLKENEVEDVVVRRGWVPQREALEETFNADLLLLFQGFDSGVAAAIPRKLGEYIITNIPIMAFAQPGEIHNLINRYNCGIAIASPEIRPIIDYLDKSFNKWLARKKDGRTDTEGLRSVPDLETSGQVEKLADICRRVIK